MLKGRKKSNYIRKHNRAYGWCKQLIKLNSRTNLTKYNIVCSRMKFVNNRKFIKLKYQIFKNNLSIVKLLRFDHLSYIKTRRVWK